jgi:hypothetical protein
VVVTTGSTGSDSDFEIDLVDARRAPTATLAGWRSFVNTGPNDLELLPDERLTALSEQQRAVYDEQRVAYHSELIVVHTSTVKDVIHQGRLLTLLNQREISARRSLIVSGPWATGKTTAIKMPGKTHEVRTRLRFPDQARIPFSVQAGVTARGWRIQAHHLIERRFANVMGWQNERLGHVRGHSVGAPGVHERVAEVDPVWGERHGDGDA